MVPSPSSSETFLTPARWMFSRACCEQRRNRSIEKTCATRCASSTVWYPEPVPISSTRSLPLSCEHLEIARVHPRLRNRLSVPDRQRRVFVRAMPEARRHERVARRHLDGAQHGEVANSLVAQRLDEPVPRAEKLAVVRRSVAQRLARATRSPRPPARRGASGRGEAASPRRTRPRQRGSRSPFRRSTRPARHRSSRSAAPRVLHRRDGLRVNPAAEPRELHALHLVADKRRQVDVEQRVGGKRGKRREMPQQRA